MAHALEQTWQRREGRTLTVSGYRDSGGIGGAVAQTAEGVFEELDTAERSALRDLLRRLVTVTAEGDPVRVWVPVRQLASEASLDLVERLARARLLTVDDGAVAVAHESLARAWPRLRAWLEDDVEGQRILRHLTVAAESWEGLDRTESELYRGIRLSRALEWRERTTDALTPVETAFLVESGRVDQREREREAVATTHRLRQRRTTRGLVAGIVALVLVAGTTAGLAVRQRNRASDAATARWATTAAAVAHESSDPTTALLAGVEAVRLRDDTGTRAALLGALTRWPALLTSRLAPDSRSIDVEADGRLVVGSDHGFSVLDPGSLAEQENHWGSGSGVKVFPDGRRVLTGNDDGIVEIADLDAGTWVPLHHDGNGRAWGLQVDASGDVVAAGLFREGDEVSDVVMWRGTTRLPGLTRQSISDFALAPKGDRLYLHVAAPTAAISVYDVASGRLMASAALDGADRTDTRAAGATVPMAISPDGRTLALGGGELSLVDTASLKVRRRLADPIGQTVSLAFSRDGKLLAGGSDERALTVWDLENGRAEQMDELSEAVADLEFSPDGSTLYVLTADHRLSAWDVGGERRLVRRVRAGVGPGPVAGPLVVPAPDGEVVAYMEPTPATQDRADSIRLLDVTTGRLLEPLVGTYQNWGVWRPPGADHLAVPGDRTIRVWDWRSGDVVMEKEVAQGPVEALAYTPDGSNLIVGERAGYVYQVRASDLVANGPRIAVAGTLHEVIWAGRDRVLAVLERRSEIVLSLVDLRGGRTLSTRPLEVDVTHADVSPDGRRLAVGALNGEVGILDLDSGDWVKEPVRAHQGFVLRVDFSADGSLLVSSGDDGRVRLWDGRSGSPRESTTIGRVGVPSAAIFQPDGHTLLLAAADGSVRRWDTRVSSWVSLACERAGRNLSRVEWALVFGDQMPYHPTCSSP